MAYEKSPHPNELILKGSAVRGWVAQVGLALLFTAVLAKGAYLVFSQHDFLNAQAESRSHRSVEIDPRRGQILDRNGLLLADSLQVYSLWVDSTQFKEGKQSASKRLLTDHLKYPLKEFDQQVRSKRYWRLAKNLDTESYKAIKALRLKGLHFEESYRRVYPHDNLFSQVIGLVGSEGKGMEGLERLYESRLVGKPGLRHYIRDGKGNLVSSPEREVRSIPGETLHLSVDAHVQYLLRRELQKALADHKANFAAGVVLQVRTGEVLAISSVPDFNPNEPVKSQDLLQNKAVSQSFEPGSTIKPFVAAAALNERKINSKTYQIDSEQTLRFGKYSVKDQHPDGIMDLSRILQKSSNVGSVLLAQALGAPLLSEYYLKIGVGQKPNSGLYNEASYPLAANPQKWKDIELATRAYGHGVSMSLLQLARSYMALARSDGAIPDLRLIQSRAQTRLHPVFDPQVPELLRPMLQSVLEKEGTAKRAQPDFYTAAGKTGTSKKIVGGRYVNEYMSYFVGFAPAANPELIVAVVVDRPSAGQYYGGAVAAPVFKSVMDASLPYLKIAPDRIEPPHAKTQRPLP